AVVRHVLSFSRRRLRRRELVERRARIPGYVSRARSSGRTRALALRQRWPRLAVLYRRRPSLRGTPPPNDAADADHEPPAGDRLQVLRPAVSEPGHDAERRLRESHRGPFAATGAGEGQQRVRGGHDRAPPPSMGG